MIKENDILEVIIDDLGSNGEGIAHYGGQSIFIPYTLIDEKVKIKISYCSKKIVVGEIINIIQNSPDRVEPRCKYFTLCGGCDLQHLDYEKSLLFKQNLVKNTFKKIADLDVDVCSCEKSKNIYNYRNKISLPVREVNGKTILGLFKKDSHNVVEIDSCPIQKDFTNKLIKISKDYIARYDIKGYNEITKTGILKFVVAREVNDCVLVTLVVKHKNIAGLEYLSKMLEENFTEFGLSLCINEKDNNVILTDKIVYIAGIKELEIEELGINYKVNPLSFFQVNDYIKTKIYNDVLENISETATVVDAYSGAGLLTAIVAKKCKNAIGIEIIEPAVKDANMLISANDIKNVKNICGDCSKILPNVLKDIKCEINLILDPPRKGCDEKVINSILSTNIDKIIYVSCSPQTLARDVKLLKNTYKIVKIKPYDMFPQTKHIETICVMKKL